MLHVEIYASAYWHACMHACMHAHAPRHDKCMHSCMHTCMHEHMCTCSAHMYTTCVHDKSFTVLSNFFGTMYTYVHICTHGQHMSTTKRLVKGKYVCIYDSMCTYDTHGFSLGPTQKFDVHIHPPMCTSGHFGVHICVHRYRDVHMTDT